MSDFLPVRIKVIDRGVRVRLPIDRTELRFKLPIDEAYAEIILTDDEAIEIGDLLCRIVANRE